jgi:hypothetical protein
MNRQEAIACGSTHYNGKICPAHLRLKGKRFTSSRNCVACTREGAAVVAAALKAIRAPRVLAQQAARRSRNEARVREVEMNVNKVRENRMRTHRPTAQRLCELLEYDPGTGVWTRRWLRGGRRKGSKAGLITNRGYLAIRVDGGRYKSADLAYLYMTGKWPPLELDSVSDSFTANGEQVSAKE